jgi:two-component system chemotaxis sensor kinase CheA
VKIDVEVVERLTHVAATLGALEARLASRVDEASRAAFAELWKATAEVREIGALMSAVSVSGLFQKMSRMVRDLSKKTGKLARVVLQGEETTAPRGMVEKLGDPLVHMIRNALDHGIEDTDGRRGSGKALLATVGLSAVRDERTVTIELSDDGRGIDASRVLKKAIDKGIVSPDADLSESDVFLLIFAPGFSTAEQVTALSGRGVGMDVVKRNIESLGGRIEISSRLGQGTRFKMVLPLVG